MEVEIMDIVPVSTTDWKGHCSIVVFFAGCPFNCVYCSNHAHLNDGKYVDITDIEDQITKASEFVDSVVFSGGEPLMHAESLEQLIDHARSLGLKVGIHTNGAYRDALWNLLVHHKLDGVMLDLKAPLNCYYESNYSRVTRASGARKMVLDTWWHDLLDHKIKPEYYEVRTVVFKGINDTPSEVATIAAHALLADSYVLVQGISSISPEPLDEVSYDELMELAHVAAKVHPNVWVRSKLGERRVEAQQV